VLAAALLLLPSALPQARKPAKPVKVPAAKLDINLLVTAEPEKVFHPTKGPDGQYSKAAPLKIAPRGKLIAVLVYFKDCKPDAAGNCNVDLDLQGLTPNGSMFENRKGTDLWRNKRSPPPGFTQLGTDYMKIQVEPKDPAGTYRVIAVAHDRNGKTDARAEASFEVR
jgi:hypothetical protein